MGLELAKLKSLLGIPIDDFSKDLQLEFIIDDVTEIILNYCNIKKLPSGLTQTGYRMAIDLYRNENIGSDTTGEGSIASIKEGDTTVSFNKSTDSSFKDTVLKNYYSQLNRYRRLVW